MLVSFYRMWAELGPRCASSAFSFILLLGVCFRMSCWKVQCRSRSKAFQQIVSQHVNNLKHAIKAESIPESPESVDATLITEETHELFQHQDFFINVLIKKHCKSNYSVCCRAKNIIDNQKLHTINLFLPIYMSYMM